MSHSAADPQASMPDADRRGNAIALLLVLGTAFALMVRINISPGLMDSLVNYSAEGGAFYEKLHFGTYLIFLMLPLALFARPFQLRGDEIGKFKALLGFCAGLVALIVILFLTDRPGSSVFLIDSYLVAGAAGLIMLALGAEARRALGDFVLVMLILSAVIGLGEAATRQRLLPYDLVELQFRPLGLSEHPLALGAFCATAVGFVALTRWRIWVRVAAILALFVGCIASGARFALLLTVAEIMALMLFVRWPRLTPRDELRAKFIVFVMSLAGGAVIVAALAAGGLLSRFGSTLFDENFFARVDIYQVFGLVSWQDIIFGMPGADLLAIVNEKLHLPYIESAQVVIIMTFGLPLAIVFTWMVVWIFLRLLRRAPLAAWIGTTTFFLAALSNNTLSAKQPAITIIVVLILAYGARPSQDRTQA